MKFAHVTITVKDLDESIQFYRDIVGLPVDRRYPAGPGTEIAFLGNESTKVELIQRNADYSYGKDISIGFETDSVTALAASLQAKGYDVGEMIQPNPHVVFFYITDPNGVKVQFLEHK
jgi:lactoylglutathione lyase